MRFSEVRHAGHQVALQRGSANYIPAASNECFESPHTLTSMEDFCFINC